MSTVVAMPPVKSGDNNTPSAPPAAPAAPATVPFHYTQTDITGIDSPTPAIRATNLNPTVVSKTT